MSDREMFLFWSLLWIIFCLSVLLWKLRKY